MSVVAPPFTPDPAWLKASEEDRAQAMQRWIDALTPDDLWATVQPLMEVSIECRGRTFAREGLGI